MPRRNPHSDNWEFGSARPHEETTQPQPRPRMRRVATAIAFTTMFFSGAALTAVAGDQLSAHMSADDLAADGTTTTDAAAPSEAPAPADAPAAPAPEAAPPADAAPSAAAEPAPAADSSVSSADDVPQAPTPAGDAASPSEPGADAAPAADAPAALSAPAPRSKRTRAPKSRPSKIVLLPALKPAPKPELEGPAAGATVWLNAVEPDPTPPAKRLTGAFGRRLSATAESSGVDWAFLLGVLRAKGATGRTPADASTLTKLAGRLSDLHQDRSGWATALAYGGSAAFADRAVALARYDRAVGLLGLTHGLEGVKDALGAKLLADPQITIYEGGRRDIALGRVDVRVLATIAYLHEAYGQVTVSCLIAGHRLYARPGHISAHIYGRAVDIASLGGESILGNSSPGGLTEHAVRDLLLLPREVMPQQIISLLGLGGPSFPLANHYDHIHVGF